MAAAQRADASITAVPPATTGLVIRDIPQDHYGNSISCDISTADPDHSSQTRGNAPCFMLYTTSPIRQSEQRNNWSRIRLYGLAYGSKSAFGRKLVFVVKRPKYIDTHRPSGPVCACDTPFRSHPRRHSGSSATVTELSIPIHSGRQVHPMAGSDPTC